MTARVGIAVVAYNSATPLAALLASLADEPYERIVVWDNASRPEELHAVEEEVARTPRARLVASPHNLGFGEGANRAVAELGDGLDYVWLLNPDIVLRPGALATLVASAERHGADLLSPLVLDPAGRIWYAGGRLLLRSGRSVHDGIGEDAERLPGGFHAVGFVTGAAPLIRRSAWERLGGFDASYFLYCEDAELSLRAAEAGLGLGVEQDAVVVHDAGGSSGGGQSPAFSYYVQRNRLRLYRSHSSRLGLLLGPGLAEEARLLLVPFRDRGLGGFRNLAASLRGIAAGWRGEQGPAPGTPQAEPPLRPLRVYEEARTAHLERARDDGAQLVYRRRSYDFDERLAALAGAEQLAPRQAARLIASGRFGLVEVNEPLMIGAWPSLLRYARAARRARRRLGEDWHGLVAYAIENGDVALWLHRKTRLPLALARWITRSVARRIARETSRLAYGSPGAAALYASVLGESPVPRTRLFDALEPPCPCMAEAAPKDGAVFLGAFEERKGVPQLMAAWPEAAAAPAARLTVIGTGPLEARLRDWADARDDAGLVVDPPRERIHELLRGARVLVLLSQPTRYWREQLGLPILEGLSHGCEIVTTSETGLADWLAGHGHAVLDPAAGPAETAAAIAAALAARRSTADILAALPVTGGRAEADRWLAGRTPEEAG